MHLSAKYLTDHNAGAVYRLQQVLSTGYNHGAIYTGYKSLSTRYNQPNGVSRSFELLLWPVSVAAW